MILRLPLLVLFVLTVLSATVYADEPRRINFGAVITDFDGNALEECADIPLPATDRECKTRRLVTLGAVSMRSLLNAEQGLAAEDSFKRGELARLVYKAGEISLSAENIALLKKQIAKLYGPLLVAQTFPLLDPAAKP